MEIDTSTLDPAQASAAMTFKTMIEMMPSDAVRFLRQLCEKELRERGEPVDD